MTADELEQGCTELIAYSGESRSYFLTAVSAAEKGNFAEAEEQMKSGREFLVNAHNAHSAFLADERVLRGDDLPLLLVHAEDLLMSAEVIELMAGALIKLNERLK